MWDGAVDERQANVFPVIEDYQNMMNRADAEYFPDMPGKQQEEAFWRTLNWNANRDDRYPAPQEYSRAFLHLTKKKAYNIPIGTPPCDVEDLPQFRVVPGGDAPRYYETFLRNGFRRRFFITSKGHLGSGPASMEKDDEVYIIFGAKFLIILRKEPSCPGYRLIGQAYIHGIMHGEALSAMKPKLGPNGTGTLGSESFVLV